MNPIDSSSSKFCCSVCNYETMRNSQYIRHKLTAKHKRLISAIRLTNTKVPLTNAVYNCICEKSYKHMSSLCAHKRKCQTIINNKQSANTSVNTIQDKTTIDMMKDMMIEMFRSNNELKNVLLEIAKEPKVVNNIQNMQNTQNTQNNSFNLQLFLNEKCKDAITANQFANNIEVSMSDLHNVGAKGYVEGLSQIIINELRKMDITKRPFHCTDLKREVIYIKDTDAWNKDNEEKSKLKLLIGQVAGKNLNKLYEWQAEHPNMLVLDSDDYFTNHKLLYNAHGGETELTVLKDKVIKLIAKEVHLDRSNNST